MKPGVRLKHEFVDFIPNELEDGTIYISIDFATVAHKCCCGCKGEVITPLSPTDWKLIFDGKTISLDPSIGNWNFTCQSHYWIKQNNVKWARRWSKEEISYGRAHDSLVKERYFGRARTKVAHETAANLIDPSKENNKDNIWRKFKNWILRTN